MVLIVLLLLPVTIAERYTSPTQDGQYILNPIKAWGFVLTLVGVDNSAVLGSSGDALREARSLFVDTTEQPVRVELLYLPEEQPYVYVRRTGRTFLIAVPPLLVWEVWGSSRGRTNSEEPTDVIGFLDYDSGRMLGLSESVAGRDR